jgi:superfamily II DNA/RNA helicase
MNETDSFEGMNIKMLIIDEVDRILDMGFKESIDQIMKNISKNHQTMLFSATVGKDLKDLARVNLNN